MRNIQLAGSENQAGHKFNSVELANLTEESTQVEWRVEGLFPMNGIVAISGFSGAAKSMLMSHLAIAITGGGEWLNQFKTKPATVLHIDADNDERAIKDRYKRLSKGYGYDGTPRGIFYWPEADISLSDPKSAEMLEKEIIERACPIAILDSLEDFLGDFDEQNNSDMVRALTILKRIARQADCLIILIAHDGKPGAYPKTGKLRHRGASSKVDKFLAMISATCINEKENIYRLEHSKAKYQKPFESFNVKLTDVSQDSLQINVIEGQGKQAAKKLTITELVKNRLQEGEIEASSVKAFAKQYNVPERALRAELKSQGRKTAMPKSSVAKGGRPPQIWVRK